MQIKNTYLFYPVRKYNFTKSYICVIINAAGGAVIWIKRKSKDLLR